MNIIQRLILIIAAMVVGYMMLYPNGLLIARVFGITVIAAMLVLAARNLDLHEISEWFTRYKKDIKRVIVIGALCFIVGLGIEPIEINEYLSFDPLAGDEYKNPNSKKIISTDPFAIDEHKNQKIISSDPNWGKPIEQPKSCIEIPLNKWLCWKSHSE